MQTWAQTSHQSAGEWRGKCSAQAATCPHCSCIKQQAAWCSASASSQRLPLYHTLFRFLLIPLCVSLRFLCVVPSCRQLFLGSVGNKCMRFQWLILLLRTGEPNMYRRDIQAGRVCVRKRRGRAERRGIQRRMADQRKQWLECVCCWGGGWQVMETWDT